MVKIKVLGMAALVMLLLPATDLQAKKKVWNATGHDAVPQNYSVGVPAFDAVNIDYREDGHSVLSVKVGPQQLVAVADTPKPWGYYQFPELNWGGDGEIVLRWANHEDVLNGKGEPMGLRVSRDKGKTWVVPDKAPFFLDRYSVVLPNGNFLNVRTQHAPEVKKIQGFPSVAFPRTPTRNVVLYRDSEIPAQYQNQKTVLADVKNRKMVEYPGIIEETPRFLRQTISDCLPFNWWGDKRVLSDGSVMTVIYPHWYENEDGTVDLNGVGCYRTWDEGHHWKYVGRIPYAYDPVKDPNGPKRKNYGFTEPSVEVLPDGTFVCILRTDGEFGRGPMYISYSSDEGKTWTRPKYFAPSGVLPRTLQLPNGVLVLSSGRPGVQLRFSWDGKGEQWTDPFDLLPFGGDDPGASCGYTELLAISEDTFLVVYSDFRTPAPDGNLRKGIKVRKVTVKKK